jgi:hypothetical protein
LAVPRDLSAKMVQTVSSALEKAIDDAVTSAPAEIREVVRALQALRGVGQPVAISIVAEL